MKKLILFGLLAGVTFAGSIKPASAQVIPNVRGLTPFTAETNFMSLPGYLRWQYYTENTVWLSRAEATALVNSQAGSTTG